MIKNLTILLTVLVGAFILLPSFIPETSPVRKYLPGKQINLGLDLRGGIHIVLGVEVRKALEVELDKFSQDLKTRLEEKNVLVASLERLPQEQAALLKVRNPQDVKVLEQEARENFYEVLVLDEWVEPTAVKLKLESQYADQVVRQSLEQAREIIRNRVDEFGVAEPIIQLQGADRILVQLPGVTDPDRAIQLIGKTALLEFKIVSNQLTLPEVQRIVDEVRKGQKFSNNLTRSELVKLNELAKSKLPAGTEISFERSVDPASREVTLIPYLLESATLLTGQALEDARISTDPTSQKPLVALRFNRPGAIEFEKITEVNVGRSLAILLDGMVMSAPYLRERIPAAGAGATIEMGRGSRRQILQEAKDLVLVLRSGALPAPVEVLENRTVGASLGQDSIERGKLTALIVSLLVLIFMLVYYRMSGLVANIALAINMLMVLSLMALFQATLTLPGIAGIVLTVGMAVDANVIILERVREELRSGKKVRAALEAGFENAHSAIFDANLTTVIAGVVLYQLGTGPIKGFAVTLLIGLICNYIAAVWFSRWIYDWYYQRRPAAGLSI